MMASLPIRRAQFRCADFAAWLASNGAEIGMPTNPYEVIRYRAYQPGRARAATHVVYAKESGLLNFQGASAAHYEAFLSGWSVTLRRLPADGGVFLVTPPADPDLSASAKMRKRLLKRDGDECWFCGVAMGEDVTLEHLVPKSKGGANSHTNYALAHRACNNAAADMPLVQKIALRERMRTEASVPARNTQFNSGDGK